MIPGFSQSIAVAGWNERIVNACESAEWYESILLTPPEVPVLPKLPLHTGGVFMSAWPGFSTRYRTPGSYQLSFDSLM